MNIASLPARAFAVTILLLTAASPRSSRAEDSPAAREALSRSFFTNPVGNLQDRHIEDLGLVIWGAKPIDLLEQSLQGLTRHVPGSEKPAQGSIPNPALVPVSPMGHPEFTLNNLTIVARLQNSLDVDESKAQAATYQWIRDAQMGSYWNVDAAAIVDWYFPVGAGFFAYNTQKMAAHLRTGVAWERVTAGSAVTSVDLREAFLGVGFRLKPFSAQERQNFQHQSEFQIGLNYKENAVTNDSQWSFDLNVQPVFRFLPPLLKDQLPFAIGEHWLIHKSDRLAASDTTAPAAVAGTSDNPANKGASTLENIPDYFYLKPNFTLRSVFSDFTKSGGKVNPGDYQVDWGSRVGFGFFHDKLRLSYQLSGVTPLDQMDRSFIFQEARAEIGPFPGFPGVFSARYTKGKRAPSYINEDRVILAVGIKF
ncbi:hypothetical protein [Prosthecobacter sp.]|uniref:hypothetical protein n=1 Tax=Prosthecobacter sp. TaxID=1965333 RepID=UPI0037839C14